VTTNSPEREIIFEFHRLGAYVKVSAIDVSTKCEVSITGAANAPQEYLQRLARQKLALALEKESNDRR
jgi:hypothetical protein